MKTLSLRFATATLLVVGTASDGHPSGNRSLHLHDDVVRDGRADIIFRGGTSNHRACCNHRAAQGGPRPQPTKAG